MNLTSGQVVEGREDKHNLLLFFQHHAGDIRWMQHTNSWQGGTIYEVIANDAKNGTPISAKESHSDGLESFHVFCKSRQIRIIFDVYI